MGIVWHAVTEQPPLSAQSAERIIAKLVTAVVDAMDYPMRN